MPESQVNRLQSIYVAAVASIGVAVVTESIIQFSAELPGLEWFLLAALTLVTGSFTVKLPGLSSKISISETFVFSSVLLFGPAGGTLHRCSRHPSHLTLDEAGQAFDIEGALQRLGSGACASHS